MEQFLTDDDLFGLLDELYATGKFDFENINDVGQVNTNRSLGKGTCCICI